MSSITLQLLANPVTQAYTELGLTVHVHKRIEKFSYLKSVPQDSIPLAYLENPSLNSRKNVSIIDRSFSVTNNSSYLVGIGSSFEKHLGKTFYSRYRDLLITNQTLVDSESQLQPLFYKHRLPEGTVNAEIEIVKSGNRFFTQEGYRIDLEDSAIYTNYQNYFDIDSGSYRLVFVNTSDASGNTTHTLLNAEPVAHEATWEDIDLDTGLLKTGQPTFSRTTSGDGYLFTMNQTSVWFYKPQAQSLLKPAGVVGVTSEDPWYMRFQAGAFSSLVNGAMRKYWVPEFYYQNFFPTAPYLNSLSTTLVRVAGRIFATPDRKIYVAPDAGTHLEVLVYDAGGILIKAWTTNPTLSGVRFSNTSIFWESDRISSWDQQQGLIQFGVELNSGWELKANYIHETTEFLYNQQNLNPLYDPSVLDKVFVYYLVPNVVSTEQALNHLILDENGVITYCSQVGGTSLPCLSLETSGGAYNSDTIVGMLYSSVEETDTFLNLYAAGNSNDNAYLILAEVCVTDNSMPERQIEIDVSRHAPALASIEDAIQKNPKLLQSVYGYGPEGQVVPLDAVMFTQAPITLLREYGGYLDQTQAEELIRKYMPSSGYAVIDWEYPHSTIIVDSPVIGQARVRYTWEGTYNYKIYRRTAATAWELISTNSAPADPDPVTTITYTQSSLDSGKVYYYAVRLEEGSILYPASTAYGISIR